MSILNIKSVTAGYGELKIVKDISLEINQGEITVLLGSNGAGKTTLIHSIVGLVSDKNGSIIFDNSEIIHLPAFEIVKKGIILVPQGRGLFSKMSVLENLYLGSYLPGTRNKREGLLDEVFSIFPILKERSKQKAGSLSGGEQQMLAVARALMAKPKLLILDEPSLGLAPKIVDSLFKTIQMINSEMNITVFLVEQNLKKALSVASKGYLLASGKMVLSGKKEELILNKEVKEAYLGI